MAQIRAVGFDLDGTLFDHRGSATDGVNAFFRFLGVEPSEANRALWFAAEDEGFEKWRAGELSFQEQRRFRLRTVLPAVGAAPPESPDDLDALFERYLRAYRTAWRAFPDAARVLTALRSRGLRLGILTNGTEEQQTDKLRAIGLYGLVDVVCTSEGIGVQKPDPRAFEALAERLGVAPSECLFIGDHPEHDIAGAISAGMGAALIDRYADDAETLESVIRSLR